MVLDCVSNSVVYNNMIDNQLYMVNMFATIDQLGHMLHIVLHCRTCLCGHLVQADPALHLNANNSLPVFGIIYAAASIVTVH